MPAARPRSPAQIEAARRNGAKSRGPVSAEGKARSSRNALKHGMTAETHFLLEGEDPAAYEELSRNLVEEHDPETETDARLVQRLAAALWRLDRADRLERQLFADAPRPRFITPDGFAHASPEGAFDLARFEAIRRYREGLGREVTRCLAELRRLSRERAPISQNDPDERPAAQPRPAPAPLPPERPSPPRGPPRTPKGTRPRPR